MSSLVNVKVKYIRPKYKDLKEWIEDKNNVYIGRKCVVFINNERFPKQNSLFYNPFKIDKNNSREKVIQLYKHYILEKIKNKEVDLSTLFGKNLGCWCYPESCHGEVLMELLKNTDK